MSAAQRPTSTTKEIPMGTAVDKAAEILGLSPDEAKAEIEKCQSVTVLRELLEGEERKAVIKAAKLRREALEMADATDPFEGGSDGKLEGEEDGDDDGDDGDEGVGDLDAHDEPDEKVAKRGKKGV